MSTLGALLALLVLVIGAALVGVGQVARTERRRRA